MILNGGQLEIHVTPVAFARGFDVHSHLGRSAQQVGERLLPRCQLRLAALPLSLTILTTPVDTVGQRDPAQSAE
jgi:hypothetical protein